MKLLFFARKSLWAQPGGDTVHLQQTAEALGRRGHRVEVVTEVSELRALLAREPWDVLHSINLGRWADQIPCLEARRAYPGMRWVVSSVLVDYRAYDAQRAPFAAKLPQGWVEVVKAAVRALRGQDRWPGWSVLRPNRLSAELAWSADALVATTEAEALTLRNRWGLGASVHTVPPGADHLTLVSMPEDQPRRGWLLPARVEGLKNHVFAVELWGAMAQRGFIEPLRLYGDCAPNHRRYRNQLTQAIQSARAAGADIEWLPRLEPEDLAAAYAAARGVLVPSLSETYGLTVAEARRAGCQVVAAPGVLGAPEWGTEVHVAPLTLEAWESAVRTADANADLELGSERAPLLTWIRAAEQLEQIYSGLRGRISITGSRGIPNRYGGYEELVDHLARGLARVGWRVDVATSSTHPVTEWSHPGVRRRVHWDPEPWMGSAGQFIYDLLSLRDTAWQRPDVHLTLGTTSSAPWLALKFLRGSAPLAVHLDGLEWMRGKYRPEVQRYLKWAERTAAASADLLVADHPEMARYALRYAKPCAEIAYGVDDPQPAGGLDPLLGLQPGGYALIVARLVPENHVLVAAAALSPAVPVVVVGPFENAEGRALQQLPNVHLLGGQFDASLLNSLRAQCGLYLHGHSAGGTNPGLLQAMAAGCTIAAHDNAFNRRILGDSAYYFTAEDAGEQLAQAWAQRATMTRNHRATLDRGYRWPVIVNQYDTALKGLCGS
ncbi:MAG: glycosyltransferase [Bacteroidetes bacterium]|nr:glycosyltransferase [Bacteroidota bacterium]